jgi:hypothetical protein
METVAHINANPFAGELQELERLALEECVKRQRLDHRVSVLVLPTGTSDLACRFARLGAQVTLGDEPGRRRDIEGRILAAGLRDEVRFAACTPDAMPEDIPGEPFDIIVIRRGLCAMRHEAARQAVRRLLLELRIGGKLYVSVLGLHSELGDGYPAAETPVEERFAELAPAIAAKYGVSGPVCLYTERNLFMLLLAAGASVLRTMTTTYGNVKGIAVRV